MDLNQEYAAHQLALIAVDDATDDDQRNATLAKASRIAGRIGSFQHGLGAAAACAWSIAHCAGPAIAAGPDAGERLNPA
tara:strand:- start:285 stop:521 length:237 start_codon:yes stop_codon:yes gene_type:complete